MKAPVHLYNKITPKTPNVYTFLRVFFLRTIKNEGINFFLENYACKTYLEFAMKGY